MLSAEMLEMKSFSYLLLGESDLHFSIAIQRLAGASRTREDNQDSESG
jgi:hypothetical protein